MPEVTDVVKVATDRYQEDGDFLPNPTDAFGTMDTSATAGAADQSVEGISPIFEIAKAQDAVMAAKAVDPDDDTPDSLVVLPEGARTREDALNAVRGTADRYSSEPVALGGLNRFQRQAAEDGSEGAEIAQAQQQGQGAGSTTTANDAGRQTQGKSAASQTSQPGEKADAKADAKK